MSDPIRLLIVARQPLRVDDLGLAEVSDVAEIQLIRRPLALEVAIEETQPNVVIVDVAYPEKRGFKAIDRTIATLPGARVLALIEDPPSPADVARAVRAGAHGFVNINSDPAEFEAAIRAVHRGEYSLPDEDTRELLGLIAEDLDVTGAERRSRLAGIFVALIPLTGALAAILTLLWRKYLAHIGVRPVDLAIDPASRVIDALSLVLLLVGFFGPLLFIGNWLDMLGTGEGEVRRPTRWRKTAHIIMSIGWLAVASILDVYADLVLIVMIGPVVVVSLLATVVGLSDELPAVLRIPRAHPGRILAGGLVALIALLTVLSTEVLIAGPDLRTDGVHGVLAPRVLGFRAQPMRAFDVDEAREPREVLYLGGNADLYVLVDPCNEDTVEFVSVGSTRLVVIDEVTCPVESATES